MKLWGNVAFNPVSALTCGTLKSIARIPAPARVARPMMVEAQAVGEKLGRPLRDGRRQPHQGRGGVGAHKTSMLQDLERGRPMEIDAIVGAVAELGRLVDVPTPTIDTVYALTHHKGVAAGILAR